MKSRIGRDYWTTHHERQDANVAQRPARGWGRVQRYMHKARARVGAEPWQTYRRYLTYKVFRAHLPVREEWKCLEIGCAPGHNLTRFCSVFGYQPFGVEYGPVGAQATRDTFEQAGFSAANVMESDFFDEQFQAEHAGRYNVVLSEGFIEHFDNVRDVVRSHVNMIVPGGYLVCAIPNLCGWAYPFLALFGRDMLRAHNCDIMRRKVFERLFEGMGLTQHFCDYVGVYNFFGGIFRHEKSVRGLVTKVAVRASSLLNHAMFFGLRGRAWETPWSPYLLYLGQREARAAS
ncbi:MAG: class I SAM-dependent methyltransferase [bacterium]|nr:class I SAM-dependent methyltransferase [bacterium]